MVNSYERGNEISGPIKCGEFLVEMGNRQLCKKDQP
jgi:hypothetical protein